MAGAGFPSSFKTLTVTTLTVTGAATFAATVNVTGVLTIGGTKTLTKVGTGLVVSDSVDLYAYLSAYGLHDTNASAAIGDTGGGISGVVLGPDSAISFRSGSVLTGTTVLSLYRDATDVLAQRRGANAQTNRVYATYTDASNYRRVAYASDGITLESLGTGVAAGSLYLWNAQAGALEFATTNTRRWLIDASGHLTAYADNTYDIGASGATRPRNVYVGSAVIVGGSIFTGGGLYHTSSGSLVWTADGVMRLTDNAGTSFSRLCFGGTTSSFPALRRSGTSLEVVTADASLYAEIGASNFQAQAAGGLAVGGVQVVKAQGAAVADATGAGDVVAQLNTLLARLRAHGLIAT